MPARGGQLARALRPWWTPVFRAGGVPVGVLVDLAPHQTVLFYRTRGGRGVNMIALDSPVEVADVQLTGPALDPVEAPRLFALDRRADPSGVSGLGRVAIGAVFQPLGIVAVAFLGQTTGFTTLNFLPSLEAVRVIHGHGRATEIVPIEAQRGSPDPLAVA